MKKSIKKSLLLLLLVFITIGVTLHIKEEIDNTKDPYFFLQPQAPIISYPLKIYQKGEKINEYFWIIPKKPEYSIFGEIQQDADSIRLRISKPLDLETDYYPSRIFTDGARSKALVSTTEDEVSMILKLYKVNTDNSEVLVIDKNITKISGSSGWGLDGMLHWDHELAYIPSYTRKVGLSHDYFGRYRVEFEIMQDWPQLKIEGISYYLDIAVDIHK
ncbi:MAG: hypothetical protein LBJ88_00850 [Campylobacteraceae bacterium]|jgi:hypothetical protein|nr:hypothetical protein [Campylobacteraceae bacterium]